MGAAYLVSAPVLPTIRIPYWCAGKHPFESAVLAAEVAARSNRGVRCSYRCTHCGYFHVGAGHKGVLSSKAAVKELIR